MTETAMCDTCFQTKELLVKFWGKRHTGVCLKCQQRQRADSRADARYWRKTVIQRCGGKCEVCGFYCPAIMVLHHKRTVSHFGKGDPENLVGLCPNCHAIVHSVQPGNEIQMYGRSLWLETFMTEQQMDTLNELMLIAAQPQKRN